MAKEMLRLDQRRQWFGPEIAVEVFKQMFLPVSWAARTSEVELTSGAASIYLPKYWSIVMLSTTAVWSSVGTPSHGLQTHICRSTQNPLPLILVLAATPSAKRLFDRFLHRNELRREQERCGFHGVTGGVVERRPVRSQKSKLFEVPGVR